MATMSTTTMKTSNSSMLMEIKKITKHGITYPFGDDRSVFQAFPAGIPSKESDPFLMCDYFNMVEDIGKAKHEDDFPIGWHPHRGFDIASYLKTGIGRHGDSLGNRESYNTPGMQWLSVGSGVEHAEGGGNDIGEVMQGFQIWINVPKENKMNDPEYGTVPNEDMPLISIGGNGNGKQSSASGKGTGSGITCSSDGDGDVDRESTTSQARILAGNVGNGFNTNDDGVDDDNENNYDSSVVGPFETKQKVQMIDFEIEENDTVEFMIEDGLDTAMLYVYEGSLKTINGYNNQNQNSADDDNDSNNFKTGAIVLLDADSSTKRKISLQAASASSSNNNKKIGVMLFAGKKLKEPIVWHGPIVMNTKEEIHNTFHDMKIGKFPPKRVDWNYKVLKSKK